MPFLAQDLEDMRRGWQKVANNYNMTVYVFHNHGCYQAFSNKHQGVGQLFEIIEPEFAPAGKSAPREHGLGENEPANMATPEGCGTKL
jgi:hypothetical protein